MSSNQSSLFGTDGIRGEANRYPMTAQLALRLGRAVAHHFKARRDSAPILIGRDTRQSGPMLEHAVAAGVTSMGGDVVLAGVLPTPAIALLTRTMPALASVVISASHNSYEDNGLKIFQGNARKCSDATELELTHLIRSDVLDGQEPTGAGIGQISTMENAPRRYAELVLEKFASDLDLTGMKIAVDTANGASYRTTPHVLESLGATIALIHNQPDGCNINRKCGSTYPDVIAHHVLDAGAHVGFAHDGDADRVIFADETGEVLDGDEVLAILGLDLLRRGKLANNALVATVMSNLGLDECFNSAGGRVVRSAVGDRYVFEQMLAQDLNLGGEQSGHIILRDYNDSGDGLLTALQLLRVMRSTGKRLSELRKCMRKYPQLLINLVVKEKRPIESMPEVVAALQAVEKTLGQTGRVFLRYSGTEKKIRLLLEAREEGQLQPLAEQVLTPVRALIGC